MRLFVPRYGTNRGSYAACQRTNLSSAVHLGTESSQHPEYMLPGKAVMASFTKLPLIYRVFGGFTLTSFNSALATTQRRQQTRTCEFMAYGRRKGEPKLAFSKVL